MSARRYSRQVLRRTSHFLLLPACCLFLFLGRQDTARPTNATAAQLDRAAHLVDGQQWPAAEKLLLDLLDRTPNQPDALNLLGIVKAKLGHGEEAEKCFRSAVKANPALASAWLNLAKLYEEQGDADHALQTLELAEKRLPRDPHLLSESAMLLAKRGEYEKAAGRLEEIPPQDRTSELWDLLGRIWLSSGNLPKAEESFRRVLRTRPDWVPVLQQLAGIALKQGENRRAGEYMLQAVRLAPNSPDLLFEYSQVCMRNGFSGEAVRTMRKALLLEPNRPEFLFLLGQALMDTPDFHEALDYFKRYQELRPNDPDGEASLGWSLYFEQKYEDAKRHFEKAIQLNPDQEDAWYHLGMLAFEIDNDGARALELLNHAVQLAPQDARPHLGLGQLYARSEVNYQLARKELEKAALLDPAEPKTHYQLSQLYTRLGETALAQKELGAYKEASKNEDRRKELSLQVPPFAKQEASQR